jgi:hypothetical protein
MWIFLKTYWQSTMKKLAIPLILALATFSLTAARPFGDATGKGILLQYKCNKCHTIESQGIARDGKAPEGKQPPDLSGVGLKHDASWMQKWLLKEVELDGKKHIKKFSGTDDELKTLTAWLVTLKKK